MLHNVIVKQMCNSSWGKKKDHKGYNLPANIIINEWKSNTLVIF